MASQLLRKRNLLAAFTLLIILAVGGVLGYLELYKSFPPSPTECIHLDLAKADTQSSLRQASQLNFFAFGCQGTGKNGQKEVANSLKELKSLYGADFIFLLGDNFYGRGISGINDPQLSTKFEQMYPESIFPFKFFAVLGNHDYKQRPQAEIEYTAHSSRWNMPAQHYCINTTLADGTTVDFFAIDTDSFIKWYMSSFKVLKWLKTTLGKSTADWKIVLGHHPIWSSGKHQGSGILQRRLAPLLKKYGVNFYFAAHDHNLELLAPESNNMTTASGPYSIISGAGSHLRDLNPENKEPRSLFRVSKLGTAWMGISKNEAKLKFLSSKKEILFEKTFPKKE